MVDTTTPGTFIPHDTVAPAAPRQSSGGLNDLILLCAIVLLVASVALAVGVFLYGQFLQTESASKVDQLKRAEAAFQPELVQQLQRLDDRMHAGSTILGAHMAPTAFFDALSQATLQTVSFSTLSLDAPDAQHVSIKMQGVAQSVNSIALQADLFSKNGVISSPIFSNIARQSDGVHFDLSAVVNPAAVNYEQLVKTAVAGAAQSQSAPQTQGAFAPETTTPSGSLPSAAPAASTTSQ